MKKPLKRKSLAETHPEIAKQWHSTLNGDLTPFNITVGSGKKVWWKCDKGNDHEWETRISNRIQGKGCSICSGRKVVFSNCLATTNPDLASQWHPTRNGDLTPKNLVEGSVKKVWWKCDKEDDHEWQSTIVNRSKGNGCSVCSGKTVVKSNCLATTHPEIAKQWHSTLNGDLTPFNITVGSGEKVWWKCDKGEDHEWEARIEKGGIGCAICNGKKVVKSNRLATTHPDLAKKWHPTKNGNLTSFDITAGSNKTIWWKCDKGYDHEWETSVNNFTRKEQKCPICLNQIVVKSNCLATTYPELAKQWHPSKNGNLTPFDITAGSNKTIWWKCDKGEDHEWNVASSHRINGRNCPICSGHKTVLSTSIVTTHIKVAKQWHPTLNGTLKPYQFSLGSNKKVWWKCDKGEDHVWHTVIASRNHSDCPFCTLTPQSKQELTITFELMKLFKNIDPKGLKTKLEGRLRAIDIYIPKLNLCIEFDGSYWHKDKRDIDKIKSEMLLQEGFKLIRVREEPLKKIYDTDLISKKPYNGKQVTNDLLSVILSLFNLETKLVSKIKEYQSKDSLQNEKGLDKYIDKILSEKTEKK